MTNSFKNPKNFDSPPLLDDLTNVMEDASVPYTAEEQVVDNSEVLRVKEAYEDQLLAIDGVMGVGIQQNEIGDEVIWVYLRNEYAYRQIPSKLEGITVVTEITGEFDAY